MNFCSYISLSKISVVNFMIGWQLFPSSINEFISSLSMFRREKTSSIYLFQVCGLKWLRFSEFLFAAMKMLAKETAMFENNF